MVFLVIWSRLDSKKLCFLKMLKCSSAICWRIGIKNGLFYPKEIDIAELII